MTHVNIAKSARALPILLHKARRVFKLVPRSNLVAATVTWNFQSPSESLLSGVDRGSLAMKSILDMIYDLVDIPDVVSRLNERVG